jgi:tRNA-specific 2-thiouridylase
MQANIKSSPSDRPRVVIAMSGGVDSSVAAALLLEQGYDVVGMMLRLWSEPGTQASNRCCTPESMGLARRVAAKLGIPFYAIDIQENFRQIIVEYFVDGYAQGITPNPCLICNRQRC